MVLHLNTSYVVIQINHGKLDFRANIRFNDNLKNIDNHKQSLLLFIFRQRTFSRKKSDVIAPEYNPFYLRVFTNAC